MRIEDVQYSIEYTIRPYLVRRHKYYEVRLFFNFASSEAYENFIRCEKFFHSHNRNMEDLDDKHYFFVSLTPEGQRYYYGYTKEGAYVGKGYGKSDIFEPRDERRDNLYKDKYFLKKIERSNRQIMATLYLKPSCSITYALRDVKRKAKKWYIEVLRNHGHHPLDKSHGKPLKKARKQVEFLDHSSEGEYYYVTEIKSESKKDRLKIVANKDEMMKTFYRGIGRVWKSFLK
jgi:hypothetical protein